MMFLLFLLAKFYLFLLFVYLLLRFHGCAKYADDDDLIAKALMTQLFNFIF